MARIDLKEIERRAFRSTFQDGLWDMFLGFVFMAFALGPLLRTQGASESTAMVAHAAYVGLLLAAFIAAKRLVTVPRLGIVTFGAERKRRLMKSRAVLAVSVVIGLLVFLLFASGNEIGLILVLALFSMNMIVVLGLMAYYLDYARLYGYAALWALSLPLGTILERHAGLADAGYVFFVTAAPAILAGVWLFAKFVREYPVNEGEITNGTAR